MKVLERLGNVGVVPVVVIEDVAQAVPAAGALLRGGVDVMEITLRTPAGLEAIRAVAADCPDMLVGAGTVTTLAQCKQALEAGAQFIVSPGFDREMVAWCVENGVAVTPGCVTPTEIMAAAALGVNVLKFFPANVYGGLEAMKALSGPFGGVRFIPTGGVDAKNLAEYLAAPFVFAVGGSWLCAKKDIAEGKFGQIEKLAAEARAIALGFELGHVGLNRPDAEDSMAIVEQFNRAFGLAVKPGASSNFAGSAVEVMKSMYLGEHGHIAIKTNSVPRAVDYLKKRGFAADESTAKYKNGALAAIYLTESFGGFAVHLVQK